MDGWKKSINHPAIGNPAIGDPPFIETHFLESESTFRVFIRGCYTSLPPLIGNNQ